ncbi:hypothetical protein [Chlamydia gallinacea]|uniref:hypothetical protein n=1 Tax=Chlamydia gallinacea TaxID=1457153 RepID=UPI00098F8F2D|nr:hypothetical protein [Chlamydia gallinacea]AQT77291.1 hypothetical protein B1F83_01325 [Chlamydia gallinacea]
MSSNNLGPLAPLGAPFPPKLFHSNCLMNLFGAIPIVGIFVGSQRILAISQYYDNLNKEGIRVSQVIIKSYGDCYITMNADAYKTGHYVRGVLEITGLGVILVIFELALKLFCCLVAGVCAVLAIPLISVMGLGGSIILVIQEIFFNTLKKVSLDS